MLVLYCFLCERRGFLKGLFLLLSTFILSNSLDAGENTTKIIGDITYNTADFQLSEQSDEEVYEALKQVYENTGSIPKGAVGAEIYVKTKEQLQQEENGIVEREIRIIQKANQQYKKIILLQKNILLHYLII